MPCFVVILAVVIAAGAITPGHTAVVDWTSTNKTLGTATGTIGPVSVTVANMASPFNSHPSLSIWEFSSVDYSYAPVPNGEIIVYGTRSDWSATFSQPVSNLLLYAAAWRGPEGEVDPVSYTFSQPFTIVSGMTAASSVGNTLTIADLPNNYGRGILRFSGPITSLSVASNSPSGNNEQGLTFGIIPEPLSLHILAIAAFATLAFRRLRHVA